MNFNQNHPAHKRERDPSVSFTLDKTNASQLDREGFSTHYANSPDVEWAKIAPNKVVVASAERAWLLQIDANTPPLSPSLLYLSQPMEKAGSVATTRQLLDGAIAAAKYAVNSDVRPPALTATRWVWRLAGSYHLTHSVPASLQKAARRFALTGRSTLAQWAREKAQEEAGHDLLALRDIQALGYDAEAVVKALVPPAAVALMDYFTRSVQDDDPIDSVGYSYTMERLAMGISEEYIQKVEDLLPANVHTTRCLRVHSSVGADAEHVEETVAMVAELSAKERDRVARACYETALLCFSPPTESYISDEEIQQRLNPLNLEKSL